MKKPVTPKPDGRQLVADFQSVQLTLATAQVARHEAERSEDALMEQLASASRGQYLQPGSINDIGGDQVVRASLDAHIKKAQAQQLQVMSAGQVGNVTADAKDSFEHRRVRVTRLSADFQPFDAVWLDQSQGFRTSEYKKQAIEGEISEVSFEKNMLLIRPKRLMRLLNSDLQVYVVYVIDPATMQPTVEITLD